MKNILKPQAFVIKKARDEKTLVNLTTGSRKTYTGKLEPGTLAHKKYGFSSLVPMGEETNLEALTNLHLLLRDTVSLKEENAATRQLSQKANNPSACERKDLRELPTITIDAETSRDLDDAISARKEGNAYRVWIHIADVSSQLPKNSFLDKKAQKRLTSIYWPTMALPMLPRSLSEEKFSLLPGTERKTITVELLLTPSGVKERAIYLSLIKSNKRFSYNEVDEFLKNTLKLDEVYSDLLTTAAQAVELDLGFSEESRELYYELEAGRVLNYNTKILGPSHKLIEKLMVLCNSQIGEYFKEKDLNAAFRAHKKIDPIKFAKAVAQVRTMSRLPEGITEEEIYGFIEQSSHKKKDLLLRLLSYTTPPAQYQIYPEPHDGLETEVYLHFTSPIRRYADLINHRILVASLAGKKQPYSQRKLAKLCEKMNAKTLESKRLSRLMDDLYLTNHLLNEQEKGIYRKPLTVTIDAFTPTGAFCSFEHRKNGFLYLDQLGPGELNEELTIFTGKYRTVELGDTIKVTLNRPDPARGRLGLRLYRTSAKKTRKNVR